MDRIAKDILKGKKRNQPELSIILKELLSLVATSYRNKLTLMMKHPGGPGVGYSERKKRKNQPEPSIIPERLPSLAVVSERNKVTEENHLP